MKRVALLAVVLAAVPLTASHAQAAEGRPQHDRDALDHFAVRSTESLRRSGATTSGAASPRTGCSTCARCRTSSIRATA